LGYVLDGPDDAAFRWHYGGVSYDMLVARVAVLSDTVPTARAAAERARANLDWFDAFSPDAVSITEAELTELTTELAEVSAAQAATKSEVVKHRTLVSVSASAAVTFGAVERGRPGMGVTLALREMLAAASQLRAAKKNLAGLARHREGLEASLEPARNAIAEARASAQRHACTDRDELAAELAEWEAQLEVDGPELRRLSAKLAAIEETLGSLPAEHERHRALREQAEARHGVTSQHAHKYRSREKRIADEIATIKRRGAMNARTVIIDGCNLLYANETNSKEGLFPLRALYDRLSEDKQVIVYFDSTITRHLQLPDLKTVAKQMGDRDIRFVASKLEADEVILNMADDPTTYVISNDSYLQYERKRAMAELRVLGAAIDGTLRKVTVPDLDLTLEYRKDR
jgi:DNA repair exonuclease SbcCD ATPase subunit